ncbi:hypothetical protein [Pseudomonas aeruginosa]|uniref:hypothetical protein n=1 Tax=Pseudomonas aeruginosa TaxID=287 RepID=UPI001A2C0C6A|nr:hypothetical protein [Pseudomonas aeruginosa]MBH9296388.1 hypothetical protein [Pseudomonas aeruginosa]MDV7936880.1 hypothetical protein [Pseudomonas aeruginosa]
MNRQCLICDSSAVLTREAAKGLTLLVGLLNGVIKGAQRSHEGSGHADVLCGLAAVAPAYPETQKAAEDVARFHFTGFDCLCLRCGALFDETAENEGGLSPG